MKNDKSNKPEVAEEGKPKVAHTAEATKAIELLYFAYRKFTEEPDRLLQKRGLNRSHHRILYFVGSREDLSVGDLLDILEISKQALNPPLRQLIEMGLILKKNDREDRRVQLLRLNAKGRRLERLLTMSQLDLLESTAAQVSDRDFNGWLKTLGKLADA